MASLKQGNSARPPSFSFSFFRINKSALSQLLKLIILDGRSRRSFVFVPQVDHTALNTSLTSARKVKWLRERMISSSAEALLMNHIKEFILHDDPIDVEKLKACLRTQVQRWSLVHYLFAIDFINF